MAIYGIIQWEEQRRRPRLPKTYVDHAHVIASRHWRFVIQVRSLQNYLLRIYQPYSVRADCGCS